MPLATVVGQRIAPRDWRSPPRPSESGSSFLQQTHAVPFAFLLQSPRNTWHAAAQPERYSPSIVAQALPARVNQARLGLRSIRSLGEVFRASDSPTPRLFSLPGPLVSAAEPFPLNFLLLFSRFPSVAGARA